MWKSTSVLSGRQFFTKSFLGDGAAVLARSSGENENHHAIEQASRRWRGGRRDDSARTCRKILISAQVAQALAKADEATDPAQPLSKEDFVDDLALTSMARLWDVGKSEPIKVGKASPTEGTLPGAVYFIVKYGELGAAARANAEVGGDSASRAVAIGAVLGAAVLVGAVQRPVRRDALPRPLRGRGGALRLLPQGLLRAGGGVHGPCQDRAEGAAPRLVPLLADAAEALLGHKALSPPSRHKTHRYPPKRPRRRPRRPCPPTPTDHPSTRGRAPHLYARTCTP